MKPLLFRALAWLTLRTPIMAIDTSHAWHMPGNGDNGLFRIAVLVVFYTLCLLIESENHRFHFPRRIISKARQLRRLLDIVLALSIVSHYFIHHGVFQWPGWEEGLNCLAELSIILIAHFVEEVIGIIYDRMGW